jgi:hypothetical protein
MTLDAPAFLTTSDISLRLGVPLSRIRTAVARGILVPAKAGRLSVFDEDDLPAIKAKLAEAKLLPADALTRS